MTKNPLNQEFEYYKNHQKDLVKEYNGKVIIIKGQQVLGAYDSKIDAYVKGQKEHNLELGTFLIQEVAEGKESYTETLFSRVAGISATRIDYSSP